MSEGEEKTPTTKAKREKTIKEIYMEQAAKVATEVIKEALETQPPPEDEKTTDKEDNFVKIIVVEQLVKSIETFRQKGNSLVDIRFGNYKGNPFGPVPVAEAVAFPVKKGGKRKRKTRRKQRGGGEDPTELLGKFFDDFLFPQLLKLPLFIAEILIPIASAQMRKVILEHSAKREKLVTQFILDSVEINLIRISKEIDEEWKTFDDNMIKLIQEEIVIPSVIQSETLEYEQKGGSGGGEEKEIDSEEITLEENTSAKDESLSTHITNAIMKELPLPAQLVQIATEFPDIFKVIDVIPKSVNKYFTIKMYEQIMHQAICEEVYQIMKGDGELLALIKETIKEFPITLALKDGLTYKDFIKTKKGYDPNPAPPPVEAKVITSVQAPVIATTVTP